MFSKKKRNARNLCFGIVPSAETMPAKLQSMKVKEGELLLKTKAKFYSMDGAEPSLPAPESEGGRMKPYQNSFYGEEKSLPEKTSFGKGAQSTCYSDLQTQPDDKDLELSRMTNFLSMTNRLFLQNLETVTSSSKLPKIKKLNLAPEKTGSYPAIPSVNPTIRVQTDRSERYFGARVIINPPESNKAGILPFNEDRPSSQRSNSHSQITLNKNPYLRENMGQSNNLHLPLSKSYLKLPPSMKELQIEFKGNGSFSVLKEVEADLSSRNSIKPRVSLGVSKPKLPSFRLQSKDTSSSHVSLSIKDLNLLQASTGSFP